MDSGSAGKAGPLTSGPHGESADGDTVSDAGQDLLEGDLVSGPRLSEAYLRFWATCSATLKVSPWPLAPSREGDVWAEVGRK